MKNAATKGRHAALTLAACVLLAAAGCGDLNIKDGFPCSKDGNCPTPYQCNKDGRCYRGSPDGGGGSGGHGGSGGQTLPDGGGTADRPSDASLDLSGDSACDSPTDPKNCGACGHDCTSLPNVSAGADGIECHAGVCFVPPAACIPGYAHCSSAADDGCEAKLSDTASCGACGVACAATTPLCVATATGHQCGATCAAPAADTCASTCVDLKSDPHNCGTCGHDCTGLPNVSPGASGVECHSGACFVPAAACAAGFGHCSTRPDDGCEADLKTPQSCGRCGNACVAPQALCSMVAAGFACSSSCASPSPDLCTTVCVNLKSDPTNCGVCNHNCSTLANVKAGATGVECRSGACYVPPTACASGHAHCSANADDGCEADLTTPAHCGSCTLSCTGTTPLCQSQTQPASCLPSCSGASPDICGTQCVNRMTDPKNCGACGHACGSLPNVKPGATSPAVQCVAGACVIQPAGCVSGFGHCSSKADDGCETDLTKPATCGSCTKACAAPTGLCSTASGSPTCSSSCTTPNPNLCGSKCVDLKTDPTNCGTCGHDCTALMHLKSGAAVTCNGSGGCVVPQSACAAGFANCSGGTSDTDGCETATNTNTNCGGCGTACNPPNAIGTCATGTCAVASCTAGWGDCTSAAGCETSLKTNTNCGGCGIPCSQSNATATCSTGTCAIASCNTNYGDCTSAAGCETLLNTASHCGSCTTTCGGATPTCSGSPATCTCASPKVSACNSMCCDKPPTNAVISCTAGTSCAVQCATNYHACNGTVSPCYGDTDTKHCGNACLDCTQANAVAACGAQNATQCANTCAVSGTQLACPASTKPTCGSWGFETGTEGWSLAHYFTPDASTGSFGANGTQHDTGSQALFIGCDMTGMGQFCNFRMNLCSSGVALDLTNKSLSLRIYTAPTTGGDLMIEQDSEMFVWALDANGDSIQGGGYLDSPNLNDALPARTWTTLTLASSSGLGPGIVGLEIQFRVYGQSWAGTVYYDNIQIK